MNLLHFKIRFFQFLDKAAKYIDDFSKKGLTQEQRIAKLGELETLMIPRDPYRRVAALRIIGELYPNLGIDPEKPLPGLVTVRSAVKSALSLGYIPDDERSILQHALVAREKPKEPSL